jgi:hypothetical protein
MDKSTGKARGRQPDAQGGMLLSGGMLSRPCEPKPGGRAEGGPRKHGTPFVFLLLQLVNPSALLSWRVAILPFIEQDDL